jgi:3-oxoadipate enol-lactonase
MKARIDDIELAYTDEGSGTPLVLVHGFPLNRTMWNSQVSALSQDNRVIAIDLRGHGESEAPPGPYLMDVLAYDVRRLLDHLSIEQAVIAGFSMAGYATFAFYRLYPDRVKALILADTRPQPDSPEAKQGRMDMANLARTEGAGVIADRLVPRLLTEASVNNRKDLVDQVRGMITSTPVKGIAGDLMGMAERLDSQPTLDSISCPTLVIVGEQDPLTPPADSQLMAQKIKGARLETIPNAAHLSNMEQPDRFNDAVKSFMASL